MKTEKLSEDQKKKMRYLTDTYNLTRDDFFMHRHFIIITRSGIEKIQAAEKIQVYFNIEKLDRDFVVIKAKATIGEARNLYDGHDVIWVETYGEAGPENCKNTYYVMTAEKRALSRAVLKIVGLYQQGVFSEHENVQDEVNR